MAQKTLNDFTPEMEAKIPLYIAEALEGVFDGKRFEQFQWDNAAKAVWYNYEFSGFKKPVVLVGANPSETQLMLGHMIKHFEDYQKDVSQIYDMQQQADFDMNIVEQLTKKLNAKVLAGLEKYGIDFTKEYRNDYLFTLNVYSDSYLTWYAYCKDVVFHDVEHSEEVKRLDEFRALQRASKVYSAVFSEALCIVSKYPKRIHRNENNDLHNTTGLAVEFDAAMPITEFKPYFINGRSMPEWIFEKVASGTLTKEDFINENDEDIRAGIYEVVEGMRGEGGMLELLGAKVVDEKQIVHRDSSMETLQLYKTTERFQEEEDLNGKSNVPLAWLKMVCPAARFDSLRQQLARCRPLIAQRPSHQPKDSGFQFFQGFPAQGQATVLHQGLLLMPSHREGGHQLEPLRGPAW